MSFPTSYTYTSFRLYLVDNLQEIADVLGIEATIADMDEVVNDTLFDYGGITDVANASDLKKLRILGKYHALKRALKVVSLDYDFSDAGASYKRSQAFAQLKKLVAMAKKEATPYLSEHKVQVSEFDWKNDPYEWVEPDKKLRIPR